MKRLEIHSLNKGWCDVNEVILHASFQLLVNYMDGERPDLYINWNWTPEHKKVWKELRSLYKWWKKTRPARKDPLHEPGVKVPPMRWKKIEGTDTMEWIDHDKKKYPNWDKTCKKSWRLEDKWAKEDQKNLHRLIEVREYMWT